MTNKPTRRPVNSVPLLDKPESLSSNTALQRARRLFHAKEAGHTDILDPLTTRLLPICLGETTKLTQYLIDADKAYTATLKLDEANSMGNAEGEIIAAARVDTSLPGFQAACQALTGDVCQVPSMFSALKHEGKLLYEYIHGGIVIERKARDITVCSIDVTEFDTPRAVIDVYCSKGTYIRTLSEDIVKHIGTFAYLTALRHTETAGFTIAQSHTLKTSAELDEAERDVLLLPCGVLVQHFPKLELSDYAVTMLKHGQHSQSTENISARQPIRVYNQDSTSIGLVEYRKEIGRLKTLRLIDTADQ